MRSLVLNDVAIKVGVRVYCTSCKTLFDPRIEKHKKRKTDCKHFSKYQRYKSTIVVPANATNKRKRKTKIYSSRNLEDVILSAIEFKRSVKESAIEKAKAKKQIKPKLLIDCFAMYLDFKTDVGVPEHLKRNLSKGAINEFKSHIVKFSEAVKTINIDFCKIEVDDVSYEIVGAVIKYLSIYSNSLQKKAIGFYNQFYRYLNTKGYSIESPFKGIQVSDSTNHEPRAVTKVEFEKVLIAIKKGSKEDKKKNGRSIYFEWLEEAFTFAALTGRRREEFMTAKFSDIHLVDGQLIGGFIRMKDIKVSRQNKVSIGFNTRYTKAPIFPELADFLIESGYENHKNTDRYIVAGDELKQRDTLMANLTNGFAFYRNKLSMDKLIQLKGLRKMYISQMRNIFGDNSNFFTGHASSRVDKKYYYDDSELFTKIKDFKLW